mgnify:CR=1 FL=1
MATIYDMNGELIVGGLQAAHDLAGKAPVILEDDDGDWMVHPSGDVEEFVWPDPVA